MQQHEGTERRQQIAEQLRAAKIDSFLSTALPNVRYLTGFSGSNAAVLITRDGAALLLTDPRYATQAPEEADCAVKIAKGPLLKQAGQWLKRQHVRSLAYEQNRLSLAEFEQLKGAVTQVRFKPATDWVEKRRAVKSESEIALIRSSVQLNSKALDEALKRCKPGKTREVELAAELDYRMRKLGAEGSAFDTIVASGPRTALPHARPTSSPIAANELLLIDAGASLAGYASDMTRVYSTGRIDERRRRMYQAVLESQQAAIDAVRPGITADAVDRAARNVLRAYGWEKLFLHSTGHGLGLEIHEGPRLGRKDKTRLEAGMAITIEPGIYEQGIGGIRIEDTVLVTARGCEILTPTGKDLISL